MTAITWDRDDRADWADWGTVDGHKRYMVRAGYLYYNHGGQDWRFIGAVIGNGHQLAETHWLTMQGITTQRHILGVPNTTTVQPVTRRTLCINGVVLTGEVRSISTHTHGDGTQSIEVSFTPDNADDTVRVIESMRVDR